MCCFHSFFLKPLSVTLPFAARFTVLGDSEAVREVHSKPSESKNRDSGERAKGRRWRGF
jgi:hypothetical protein